ncbi:hypothetical protein DL546_004690 [Coniochaeta pulveracea]|uniref:Uncharacterized protein n=1 Tax=Coniochaeta pulveracea TaxID=177199 RepID=A0A420Y9N3_9PEZI|nr:hypothetical protein DL546_004690 [Coniochaeta pulveracea]
MEPPAKRSRQGLAPYDDVNAADELFLEPDDVNAQRDPAVQLEQARAVATYKLKSRWEHIFEKYGRDFGDEGDEIDLATGEVVVDNGHIRSLEDADDAKAGALSEADENEEDRTLSRKAGEQQLGVLAPGALMRDTSYHGQLLGVRTSAFGTPRLPTMFSSGVQYPSSWIYGSFGSPDSFLMPNKPVEPTWEVPGLPDEAYEYGARFIPAAMPRKVIRKTLAVSQDGEGDDDSDDIVLGVPPSHGKENELSKQQAEHPVTPAVTSQAQLPSFEAPEPSAESAARPTLTAHAQQQKDDSVATTDRIPGGPQRLRLPTPPATDQESDQTSRPTKPTVELQSARSYRGRQIEVVIIQHSKKQPPAPHTVPQIPDLPVAIETGGENEELNVQLDQDCRSLAVNIGDSVAMPRSSTDKSSTGTKVTRKRGPDILKRTSVSEPPSSGEISDVPVMERTRYARQCRRDQPEPGSSDSRNRLVKDAAHAKETTCQRSPDPVSSPLVKSLDKRQRRALSAVSRATNESLALEYHRDDGGMGIVQNKETSCAQDEQAILDRRLPHPESTQPVTVAEIFTRNTVDSTYDFSDEDEPSLPRSFKPPKQQGMDELREPQALVPEVSPVQVPLPTTINPPPWDKAFRREGKEPTVLDPKTDFSTDVTRPVLRHDPTVDTPVTLRVSHKVAQCLVDRGKRVTGQPGKPMTSDKPQARGLDDVSEAHASSSVLPGNIAPETSVTNPRASPEDRSATDKRRLPAALVEKGQGPLASSLVYVSVTEPNPGRDHIPATEKPVILTPASRSKISRLDSSLSKRGQEPLPAIRKEDDLRIFDLSPEINELQPDHPAARTPASRIRSSPSKYLASRSSIVSLVSDDEDELSLTLDQFSPVKIQWSQGKKYTPSTLPKKKPSTPASSVKRLAVDKARMVRLKTKRSKQGRKKSCGVSVDSPAAGLLRTPGGTTRKCGEDGFKCERDFCFVCL